MKVVRRVLIGCLATIVLAVLVLAVVAGVMLSLGPPEQRPATSSAEQAVDVPRLPAGVTPSPVEVPPPASSLTVKLELEEGNFEIRPGESGGSVRIEADYDEGLYDLTQETVATEGGQTVTVRFRSRYTMLRRLLTLGKVDGSKNRVRVILPPDVPIALAATISKGESDLDLSGLALRGLDLELQMGQHSVTFDRPNTLAIERLVLSMRMGELRTRGLGNARFRQARFDGSMGQMGLDLRGSYAADAVAVAHLSMGEMRLRVPSDIHVKSQSRVLLGESTGRRADPTQIPPGAPTLTLDGSVTMGEIRVEPD